MNRHIPRTRSGRTIMALALIVTLTAIWITTANPVRPVHAQGSCLPYNTARIVVQAGQSASYSNCTIQYLTTTGANGGAVENHGTLTLTNVLVQDNSTFGKGGGIFNDAGASLTLINVTLATNSATGDGGALFNQGTATLLNTTIGSTGSGVNTASARKRPASAIAIGTGNSSNGNGGAIATENGGLTQIVNSTIADNSSNGSGGNLYTDSGNGSQTEIKSSIVARGSPQNCGGSISSSGYNAADDTTCALTSTGDQQGLTATALALDTAMLDNGGNGTQDPLTYKLLSGSVAIGAIPASACTDFNNNPVTTDARGIARPQGGACDEGSYQSLAQFATISGTVYLNSVAPANVVNGAQLEICNTASSFCARTASAADGTYSQANIPAGTYAVTAYPPGGLTATPAQITTPPVAAGNTLTGQDLVLHAPLPPPSNVGITGPTIHGFTFNGLPIVFFQDPLTIRANDCPNGTATFKMVFEENQGYTIAGQLPETPVGSGHYQTTIPSVYPHHGLILLTITVTCPGNIIHIFSGNAYVDPSGQVVDQNGQPIPDATVTLLSAPSATGQFTAVPNGSATMSPMNRRNPDLTDAGGHYGWDVLAGFYKVQATAAGCTDTGAGTSGVLTVPPAVTGLTLQLTCTYPVIRGDALCSATSPAANTTITGSLVVPWGTQCTLTRVKVQHDVLVGPNSSLTGQALQVGRDLGAVGGSLSLDGASSVARNLGAAGTSGVNLSLSVGHDLLITGASGTPAGSNANLVCGATVGHDFALVANGAPFDVGGAPGCLSGNSIGHDAALLHNGGAITFANNTVGHDLVCDDNRGAVTLSNNTVGHRTACSATGGHN